MLQSRAESSQDNMHYRSTADGAFERERRAGPGHSKNSARGRTKRELSAIESLEKISRNKRS